MAGTTNPMDGTNREWKWDAFISYAQEFDGAIARALRDGLQAFGKSPFALRRARAFLDKSSLPASFDLPQALQDALRNSRYLIVICSPESARSPWVARETKMWLETHGGDTIFLVLAAGKLAWRDGDFSRMETDVLPEPLYGVFKSEPLWVDMTWGRGHEKPAGMPAMRAAVARLASAILNLSLDEIEGDDVRSHRILNRLRTGAITLLAVLTVCSMVFGVLAEINRRTADRQREIAMQRALAFTSQAAVAGKPSLANAQRAAAHLLAVNTESRGQETWGPALAALEALPNAIVREDAGVSSGAFMPGSRDFAIGTGQTVSRHDQTGKILWTSTIPHEVSALSSAPSGEALMVVGRSRQISVLGPDGSVTQTLSWVKPSAQADNAVDILEMRFVDKDSAVILSKEGFVAVNTRLGTASLTPDSITLAALCGAGAAWSRSDGTVLSMRLVDLDSHRTVHRHNDRVTYISCALDGASVASVDINDLLRWTLADRSTKSQLYGVRAIALAASGDRLAVNTSKVLQTGRYDGGKGSNDTLLFAGDAHTVLRRIRRRGISAVLQFHENDLLLADDQAALVRVEARKASRVDRIPTSAHIDHMVGLSETGDVLVVTKDGVIDEVNFDSGTRRPRGRTPGWATSLSLSEDRRSALLLSLISGAGVEDRRRAAVLVATDAAAGPVYLEGFRDTAVRHATTEIVGLLPDPDTGTRVAWILPTGGRRQKNLRVDGQYESVSLSADGERVLLYGQDGAALSQVDGQVLWRDRSSGVEPLFVGAGTTLLLRSEAPHLLLAGATQPIPLPFETGRVGTIQVSRNLHFAYAMVGDRHELWDLRVKQRIYAAAPNKSWSAMFAPDDSIFIAATSAGGIDIVNLTGNLEISPVDVPVTIDGEFVFYRDGSEFFVPGSEGLFRVHVLTSAVTRIDAPKEPAKITGAPGGKGFVVSYPDDTIRIFDAWDRQVLEFRLSGTLAEVAFSTDGSLVALGSHDGGVRVADLSTGRLLADVRVGTGTVTDVTFVDKDKWLLIDGQERDALVPIDPYSRLCARALRPLSPEEWQAVGGSGSPPINCH